MCPVSCMLVSARVTEVRPNLWRDWRVPNMHPGRPFFFIEC